MAHYPPLVPPRLAKLKAELRLVPRRHREDALQEAWLAHLEGRNPINAVVGYKNAEARHEEREIAASQT